MCSRSVEHPLRIYVCIYIYILLTISNRPLYRFTTEVSLKVYVEPDAI